MTDSRVDKLTDHYVRENSHPDVSDTDLAADLRDEAVWHIGDIEAAGLVVIDPDTVDSDLALSLYDAALSREIAEASAEIKRLAFGDDAR